MKDFYRAAVIVLFILVGQATIDTHDEQTTTQGQP